VAILQHASQAVLDEGVQGLLSGLAEGGFVEGKNLRVRRFNAEGDVAVSNAIAREMVNGDFDLLLTVSTVSLQAVASANVQTRKKHVFALVSNPSNTGVGISAENPLDHPAWMAGYGTMQPVVPAFEMARAMNPNLKKVGVVWNAAEANSEGQILLARAYCKQHGMELVETTVDTTAGVGEAAAALCARGVEAIFAPGDVMVMVALDTLVAAANRAGIPVFTVTPSFVKKGALFDIGADYFRVGQETGRLAAEILNGRDPASVEIVNFMPELVMLNEGVLEKVASRGWTFPESIRSRAHGVLQSDGTEVPGPATKAAAPSVQKPSKRQAPARLEMIAYTESVPAEETIAGFQRGMQESPFKEGADYTLTIRNAQGDIGVLSSLFDAAEVAKTDLLIPISTPALQAAIRKVKDRPVVFSMVANPIAAGAGKSYEDHLPNFTGITVLAPAGEMLDLLAKHYPSYKKIGTLYCPAEVNSTDLLELLVSEAKARGMTVESVAVSTPSELADAAMSLASKPIDAIVQISDNLSSGGFSAIARAARQTRKPLFSLNSTTISQGAAIALGRDYEDAGVATAHVVTRVLSGESPANIPFALSPKVVRKWNLENARAVGMEIPKALIEEFSRDAKEGQAE
jgi:ABC-type uncharacterized transport system substrate-binding protein